jgi:cytochrome P450
MTSETMAHVPPHVPASRVVDFDVYNPPGIEDGFHQAWMRLHGEGMPDLVWTPRNGGHWIATRGPLIRQFLNEPESFSARVMIVPKEAGLEHKLVPMNMDPPEHGPYRRVLNKGLGPRQIRNIEGDVRDVAIELIDKFAADGKVDFCAEYANIFPIKVFLAFSGLPLSDAPLLTKFSNSMLRPEGENPEEKAASMASANAGFFEYIAPTVAERRANPGNDWISQIIHSEVNGTPVSEYETLAMISLVLLAGLDTVVNFLPFCMDYLARDPGAVAALRDDPAGIRKRADELFRRFPVVAQARLVAQDVERDGVMLKQGEMVLIPSTLHGTDAKENEDPLTLDFGRKERSHTTFGGGAHVCAGMHLANLEIIVTLQEWLKRIPEFRVAADFRLVAHSGVVAQVERLDLEWDIL